MQVIEQKTKVNWVKITDTIEWFTCTNKMPEFDETVIVHHPSADEPVWLGYHDGEIWREVSGDAINVSHWAEMPIGPTK